MKKVANASGSFGRVSYGKSGPWAYVRPHPGLLGTLLPNWGPDPVMKTIRITK